LIGAEYMGMTLIMVYVGSVAILFLFSIMMLKMKLDFSRSFRLRNACFLMMLMFLLVSGVYFAFRFQLIGIMTESDIIVDNKISDLVGISSELYTLYSFELQVVGLILLTSMIGVVYLAMDGYKRPNFIKSQNMKEQVNTSSVNSVKILYPERGEGIKAKSTVFNRDNG
jgi:NADH-quinone oxidoreductase subunit J